MLGMTKDRRHCITRHPRGGVIVPIRPHVIGSETFPACLRLHSPSSRAAPSNCPDLINQEYMDIIGIILALDEVSAWCSTSHPLPSQWRASTRHGVFLTCQYTWISVPVIEELVPLLVVIGIGRSV